MSRSRHPNKHVEAAVQYAETLGWRVIKGSGHVWGRLCCPQATRDGCMIGVWSTPEVPENHARHIRSKIDRCAHVADGGSLDDGGSVNEGHQESV